MGDASYLCEATSKTHRPALPHLAVGLETLYDHLPLGLIFPEVSEELFLIWIVLTDPLQTAFDPTFDIGRVKSQTAVEDLSIIAVVVADGSPTAEAFVSSPTAEVTRLVEPLRASPAANTRGRLLSKGYGSRGSPRQRVTWKL
jgi:hypothetical protein